MRYARQKYTPPIIWYTSRTVRRRQENDSGNHDNKYGHVYHWNCGTLCWNAPRWRQRAPQSEKGEQWSVSGKTDYSQPAWWVPWVGWREGEGSSCSMGCGRMGELDDWLDDGSAEQREGGRCGGVWYDRKKTKNPNFCLWLRVSTQVWKKGYETMISIFWLLASGNNLKANFLLKNEWWANDASIDLD